MTENPVVRQYLISGGSDELRSAAEHLALTTRMSFTQAVAHLRAMRDVCQQARDFRQEVAVLEIKLALGSMLDGRPTERLRRYEARPLDVLWEVFVAPIERLVDWLSARLPVRI